MGPTGEKRGVHVGFGPKRTYGAKIVKIGVGGRTGPYTRPSQSLMFGLLRVKVETYRFRMGCDTTHCNTTLVSKSDVVVLAVKPNVVSKVLEELRTSLVEERNKRILVSVAAGIGLTQLQARDTF